jgi:pSer/pThr/pTyr-binding forkhead associated (FHA) protein/PAS domain-containing protein
MYRLVIVSGPNRGSSFTLNEGENSIGRQMDNHIVLTSSKVSKRHCAILVTANEILFRDEASTNGTFVNGVLSRKQSIKAGDKIGVGEFVLELVKASAPARVGVQSLTPFHGGDMPMMTMGSLAMAPSQHSASHPQLSAVPDYEPNSVTEVAPQDLPGKMKFAFENKVMPFFYGALMKNEYRSIMEVLFGVVTLAAVVGSIMPMQDLAEQAIQREGAIRAKVLSREVADRYLPFLANHTESQIDLSMLESEDSVKTVVITNPDLQIIAPQARLNQIFAGGREAQFAILAAKQFREGREQGAGMLVNPYTYVWIEPIKITDAKQIRTQVAGLSIVAIDFSGNLVASGGMGVTYGIGIVVAGLFAFFAYCILLRLSTKPFEVLNDDLDQVLRGEIPKVTHEFKISELDGLWDNINAAVQRMPRGASSEFAGDDTPVNWDHEVSAIRAVAEASQLGFVAFDSHLNLVAMNPQFEEMSGIRGETVGQTLAQMARDQAFVALMQDLQERVSSSPSRSALDQTEFSGVEYQVIAAGAGPLRDPGFAILFKKKE